MSARPIALLGLRCAGKSSVGRRLSQLLGLGFIDLDERTCVVAGHAGHPAASAGELLEEVGLLRFRGFEATALRQILEPQLGVVLATGGGVVEREDNRTWLARSAISVWLDVPAEILAQRLAAHREERPPLTAQDPADEVRNLMRRRAPRYARVADLRIEAGDRGTDELAEEIRARLFEMNSFS